MLKSVHSALIHCHSEASLSLSYLTENVLNFFHYINLPKNRRQYGTFVVKYKFGSNYPVAGFLRPDVDNNVSATGG